jgi:hypothetical protein
VFLGANDPQRSAARRTWRFEPVRARRINEVRNQRTSDGGDDGI